MKNKATRVTSKKSSVFDACKRRRQLKVVAAAMSMLCLNMQELSAADYRYDAANPVNGNTLFSKIESFDNNKVYLDTLALKWNRDACLIDVKSLSDFSISENEFEVVYSREGKFSSSTLYGAEIEDIKNLIVRRNHWIVKGDGQGTNFGRIALLSLDKVGQTEAARTIVENNCATISDFDSLNASLAFASVRNTEGVFKNNHLNIKNSNFNIGQVFGGQTGQAMDVQSNSLTIENSTFYKAYAAYTSGGYGFFTGNKLNLADATVRIKADNQTGAVAQYITAMSTSQPVAKSAELGELTVSGKLHFLNNSGTTKVNFGGTRSMVTSAEKSKIKFDGVTMSLDNVDKNFYLNIFGGYSTAEEGIGNADGNSVEIAASDLQNPTESAVADLYGGFSQYGTADDNKILVSDKSILSSDNVHVYGGKTDNDSTSGSAARNSITVDASDLKANKTLIMYGGHSANGDAEDNKVVISGSSVSSTGRAEIGGGRSEADSENYFVSGNIVSIDDSKLTASSHFAIYGGYALDASAENNLVEIKNGSYVAGEIVGAISSVRVQSSSILIDSSTIEGDVSVFDGGASTAGAGRITISGESDVKKAGLHPHQINEFKGTSDTELVLDGFRGAVGQIGFVDVNSQNEMQNIHAFDRIKFLNQSWSESSPIIAISNGDAASVFAKSSFTDDSLSFVNPEAILPGSSITLVSIESDGSKTLLYADPDSPDTRTLKGNAGTSTEFAGDIFFGDKAITYSIEEVEPAEQTFLVGDARAAASAFVNQGSDLLERVFHGFTLSREKYGFMTFATAEGIKSNYDMSDSLKINGWNFLAGVRSVNAVLSGDLTSAAFFEYGKGSYRTRNEHLGLSFRTDGDVEYAGAGLAFRYMTESGFYGEASVRAGQLSSDISHALMDNKGNFYDVDTDSLYAGIHVGLGKVFSITDAFEVDAYGKYFYTYTDSDDFMINSEKYSFDQISSNRFRLGARASCSKEGLTFLFGLAGEYEFSGESDMTAANTPSQTSDFGGFSAFAEAGVSFIPSLGSPWQFDLQVRGWQGTREAITGMLTINYLL